MLRLVLAAMRARGAQALTVLVLSVLAVAGAVGAPWYILAAERSALLADIATAPADQRVVTAARVLRLSDTDPAAGLGAFRATVERSLSIPGVRPVLGLSGLADAVGPDGGGVRVPVTYREDVCAHLTLVGRCPTGKDEALLSRYTAELMAAGIGARIPVRPPALGRATLTVQVVGLYVPTDRDEPYWSGAPATGVNGAAHRVADPVFTVLDTFVAQPALVEPSATYSVALTGEALRGTDLAAILDRADYELRPTGIGLTSGAKALVARIADDRQAIDIGVVAGAAQLLALCWFALYLAGRYTARDRRADVALLKLRGVGRGRILRLVVGQGAAPVLLGAVPGAVLGYLTARWLAGPLTGPAQVRAVQLSGAAAGVAVLGALLALVLAELGTLRAPVAVLLRRVPARGPGRAGLVDLAVVAVAVAGVYQVRAAGAAPGLAVLAPGLVALAVALLLARLLSLAAARIGGWALRTGRLPVGLGALQVARRPGTDRVFALVVIAVAVLGTAADGWSAVVVTHDAEVGARLGRAVTIRDGRVGAEGRDGQDFAVVAGDGTIQLPPELLGRYPPGTLFTVDHEDGTVSLIPGGAAGVVVPPRGSGTVPD